MNVASPFRVQVYSNPVRANKLLADWSPFVENLTFSTNAFGGFGQCTFILKRPLNQFRSMMYGWGSPPYITNRLRIVDPYGEIVYEGMIYSMTARIGTETESRTADTLYNCARVDYVVPTRSGTSNRSQWYSSASSRSKFGKKVVREELPGTYPSNSPTPLDVATRIVNQSRLPGKPDDKQKGGASNELAMEVACVGLITPALEWRYAFGTIATSVDSSQVIKDMLGANPVAEGSPGASVGPAGSGWSERLDYAREIGYGQQFISTNFANIQASGTFIERNIGSGQARIDIVQMAAKGGSVNNRRMLFQVWADGEANAGKGIAHFREKNETLPFVSGYNGYYDRANQPVVMNSGQTRIPIWRVRAGKWMTTLGIVPSGSYATIYDDPRCFWIEETTYSVDDGVLTLSTDSSINLDTYVGRLIGGKKVIKGQY